MRTEIKRFVAVVMMTTLVLVGMPTSTKAATVGQVKTIKTKTSYKYYKGVKSVKPLKWGKIKYKYGVKASWSKVSGADGYELYTYGVATKKWTKKKDTKKMNYVFTNLLEKDKFKFKVRAYKANGSERVYGAWSKVKTVKTNSLRTKIKKNCKFAKTFYDRYAAEQAFVLQNQYRKDKGVADLEWSEDLYQICKIRAKQIAKDFSHSGFMTESMNYFETKYGIQGGAVNIDNTSEYGDGKMECYMLAGGENIAGGQSDYESACKVWKDSEGHYRNMTNKDYKTGAMACYRSNKKVLWVAIFGEIDVNDARIKK
jgi:hypothetical protein